MGNKLMEALTISLSLIAIIYAFACDAFILANQHLSPRCPCASNNSKRKTEHKQLGSTSTKRSSHDVGSRNDRNGDDNNKGEGKQRIEIMHRRSIEKSSFWYAVPDNPTISENSAPIPHDPYLDSDGHLPFGSYRTIGRPINDPKRTCLLSVAVNLVNDNKDTNVDMSTAVRNMQGLVDSGFTSFHSAIPTSNKSPSNQRQQKQQRHKSMSADSTNESHSETMGMEPHPNQIYTEQNVYNSFISQTPPSVLNHCTFTTPIRIPPRTYTGSFSNGPSIVRTQITNAIRRMYGGTSSSGINSSNACLDVVQVQFNSKERNEFDFSSSSSSLPPYHLDVLDVLFEMQKEGLIRCITGAECSEHVRREAEECGFYLDGFLTHGNLLNPRGYLDLQQQNSRNSNFYGDAASQNEDQDRRHLMLTSPLAGGLLSQRFWNFPPDKCSLSGQPYSYHMTSSERAHCRSSLHSWAETQSKNDGSRGGNSIWQKFQSKMLRTLNDISLKYGVSMSSVALRWAIQLNNVGSVVVSTGLNAKDDTDDRPYTRAMDWRQTFKFELDGDDMDRLWEASGCSPHLPMFDAFGDGIEGFGDEKFPDLSNKKLWL